MSKSSSELDYDETVELEVCHKDELVCGEMKEVDLPVEEEIKLLLVRNEDGSYCAFGSKCPHNGAPLVDGVIKNGRIRCSRHGACFNSKTGDIEDYPGLDSLPKHRVSVTDGGKVVIHTTKSALQSEKRLKRMNTAEKADTKIVIIGGGAAALTCSETLRQEGYCGKITVISKGKLLPYDRPVMTKDLNAKLDDLYMRSEDFYCNYGIEMKMGKEVVALNAQDKSVICADGEVFSYDKLLIATGLKVRKLDFPGGDLKNVYGVATPEDSNVIAKKARGKRVVVIGGSFIGMEVVCFLNDICREVTVCCKKGVAFEQSFGKKVGAGLQLMHERRGVRFFTNNGAVEFKGSDRVESVILQDGTTLQADLVVAGVGTYLNTGFLKNSGLQIDQKGYLIVDKYMRTNVDDVYAAGAVVRFPLRYYDNKLVNVEHWQMAHYHGKIAGLNMLTNVRSHGQTSALEVADSVPFFFTEQYGIEIQYSGYGDEYDDVIIHGNVSNGRFSAFYLKEDEVVAVATMRNGNMAALLAEKLLAGEKMSREEINAFAIMN